MKRFTMLACVAVCVVAFCPQACLAQDGEGAGKRKVINKVIPTYPQTARSMNLSGTVRLEALVLANGKIKTVQVKGGNPLLVQSAQNAVDKWRWEKTDRETTELLEFHFAPN